MSWDWNWWIFIGLLIFFTLLSQVSRGVMNSSNIEKYGSRADYNAEPGMAIIGSVVSGAIYAAVFTGILGFVL